MSEVVQKNSELLYLYDARLCNPNGDPDEENKPRMDYEAGRNLSSDVRLKRYLRDYWLHLSDEAWRALGYDPRPDVWVRQLEDENGGLQRVSAKQRVEALAKAFGEKSAKEAAKKPEFSQRLLQRLVDARLFGATIPIGEGEGERGGGLLDVNGTGPVLLGILAQPGRDPALGHDQLPVRRPRTGGERPVRHLRERLAGQVFAFGLLRDD
ncbi:MAG: hypothetical protein KatS3mg131_1987 [Candidatus Tectimicrobiota bacterium]|nr:MAG: hypothetical protein KatS3mg131_1987 [Candidatus Tectomicrobia bacterium]